MSKRLNLEGERFGKLTVLSIAYNGKGGWRWRCKCDCGNEVIAVGAKLKYGHIRSCGCLQQENLAIYNSARKANPIYKEKLYSVWSNMKGRCYNKNDKGYKNYGGRGISICKEWLENYINFYNWSIENGYKDGLSIDRIDVNGNYEPSNCRWTTQKVQGNNRRTNNIITFRGETKTQAMWADEVGISQDALSHRLRNGWSIENALTIPPREIRKKIKFNGDEMTAKEWSEKTNIPYDTICDRLRSGWPVERALTERPKNEVTTKLVSANELCND